MSLCKNVIFFCFVKSSMNDKSAKKKFRRVGLIWNEISVKGIINCLYIMFFTAHKNTQGHHIINGQWNFMFFFSLFQQTTTTGFPDVDPTPSTERYRITRKELGYILGRNYRGLKKLYNIEINDALNVSFKYQIKCKY